MSNKFKKNDKVYYHNPTGDTIPTTVIRVSKYGSRIKLAEINIQGEYMGHRRGWVPENRVELQEACKKTMTTKKLEPKLTNNAIINPIKVRN